MDKSSGTTRTVPLVVGNLPTYVVVQKTHETLTEVYYAYSQEQAEERKAWCERMTNSPWDIALILR